MRNPRIHAKYRIPHLRTFPHSRTSYVDTLKSRFSWPFQLSSFQCPNTTHLRSSFPFYYFITPATSNSHLDFHTSHLTTSLFHYPGHFNPRSSLILPSFHSSILGKRRMYGLDLFSTQTPHRFRRNPLYNSINSVGH